MATRCSGGAIGPASRVDIAPGASTGARAAHPVRGLELRGERGRAPGRGGAKPDLGALRRGQRSRFQSRFKLAEAKNGVNSVGWAILAAPVY